MRHKNAGRKFGRNTSHRRAMFRNLTANLILHERIETTDAKAKELRRVAERLITKARRLGDVGFTAHDELTVAQKARRLAAKRLIGAYIPHFVTKIEKGGVETKVDLVEKVLVTLSKRFAKRPGGYTRTVKLGPRRGDAAPMVIIELVGEADESTEGESPKKQARVGKGSKAAATAAAPTEGSKVE